jgi:hypothetical protein
LVSQAVAFNLCSARAPPPEFANLQQCNRNSAEQPADFFPVARFRNQFSRPDIVRVVLQTLDEGEAIKQANASSRRVEQEKTVTAQLPPVIRAIDFADGQTYPFSSDALEIAYELRAPSGRPVERIEVRVDGRPLKVVALAVTQGPAPPRRTDKLLVTGLPRKDIEVALIAWSGEQASEPARLKLHWAGPRLEELLKPKLYALVIGVSDYVAANLKLDYAAKDAVDFSEALQAQEGGMYSKVEVKQLVDREVTREAVADGLEWLEQQVTHRDIGIIFVAGHGVKDDQQTYWFLPADATQLRLRTKAVPQDDLRRTLRNLAGKAILFLDTCHATAFARMASKIGDSSPGEELMTRKTSAVAFSRSSASSRSRVSCATSDCVLWSAADELR